MFIAHSHGPGMGAACSGAADVIFIMRESVKKK
jgi:hypothetical protein